MNKQLSNNHIIPALGFGTWQLAGETCYNSIIEAIRLGYRLIDTAEAYCNEKEVGDAVRKCIADGIVKREELFIITKLNPHHKIGYNETKKEINDSLAKLDLGYIDLFLIHWPNVTPDDSWKRLNAESWRAMEESYESGKIKSLGVSNFLEHHLDELFKTAKIRPVVNELNLNPTWPQRYTVEYCRKNGMQLIAWSPLVRLEEWNKDVMNSIAEKYNKTAAQISIRWSIEKGFIPIMKSKTPDRIKENINVFDFNIKNEDMQTLDDMLCHPAEHAATPDSIYTIWNQMCEISGLKMYHKQTIKKEGFKLFGLVSIVKTLFWYDKEQNIKKEKTYLLGFLPILKKKYISGNYAKVYLFSFIYIGYIYIRKNLS